MRVRLTQAIVRGAKPGTSRKFLWDTEVIGLGLLIHPSGSRNWVFQGTVSGGRRVTIRAAGLAEARKAAIALRVGLTTPKGQLADDRVGLELLTVGKLLDEWLKALASRPSPPVSLPRIRACLDNHVRPRIGEVPFVRLSRTHVLAVRDALAARGLRGMANQVVAYIRAALRWAEDALLIPEAPRWRVSRLRLGNRACALTDDQWARLLAVLDDRDSGLHPIGRLALLALALTGCRKSEITALRWDAIGQDGTLRIVRHKTSSQTGPKDVLGNHRLLVVFDDARVGIRRVADNQPTNLLRQACLESPYVFPSIARNGIGKPISRSLDDTWAEVRCRANLPETMTIHGLRGAFITQAQRLGIPIATVAALVGHESPLTTLRHYTLPTRDEVAEAASRVSGWIVSRR